MWEHNSAIVQLKRSEDVIYYIQYKSMVIEPLKMCYFRICKTKQNKTKIHTCIIHIRRSHGSI